MRCNCGSYSCYITFGSVIVSKLSIVIGFSVQMCVFIFLKLLDWSVSQTLLARTVNFILPSIDYIVHCSRCIKIINRRIGKFLEFLHSLFT